MQLRIFSLKCSPLRAWSVWALLFAMGVLWVPSPVLRAGEAPAAEQAEPDPKKPDEAPPEELASARQTMITFMTAVTSAETNRIQDAVKCMDMASIEPVDRPVAGPLRAKMLLDIFDKTWVVNYDEIVVPEGQSHWRKRLSFDGKNYGTLVLEKQANGAWLIGADFVAQIPDIYAELESVEYLEGYSGAADKDFALKLRKMIPEFFKQKGFLLEHWQWLGIFLIILFGVMLRVVVASVVDALFKRFLKEERSGVDDTLRIKSTRPLGTVAMAALYWGGIYFLLLPAAVSAFLATVAVFFMAFALVLCLYRLVEVLAAYLNMLAERTESKMDDLLVPLVRKTLKIFVVVFGIVFVADNLGVDVTSMLVGLGIGGVAFAFAAKDTVENLFGSITVLLDHPFSIGDWVVVGDLEGTVEEVGFRSTRIRTFYNSQVTVPNALFIHANVDNYGKRHKRRIKCMVSVTYSTPPDKIEAFCEGIRELVRTHPYTLNDYFHVYLNQFAASSLDILLYVFVRTPDWATELRERERLFLDIIRLADRLGVEFAFPTQTLHVETLAQPGQAWPKDPREADKLIDKPAEVIQLGAAEARALAEKHMGPGGEKPEPVKFAYDPDNPHEKRGDSDEGEG